MANDDEESTNTTASIPTPTIQYQRTSHSETTASQLISFRLPEGHPTVSPSVAPSIPPPLPYLPSDYQPSSTSPRHIVISKAHSSQQQHQEEEGGIAGGGGGGGGETPLRQRSRSVGNLLVPAQKQRGSPFALLESNTTNTSRQHFELVPYREWTVILRNEASGNIVLYNQESQQVTVQRYMPPEQHALPQVESTDECPLCHRPYSKVDQDSNTQPTFMDRNYFRLLKLAPTESPIPSNDSTPRTTQGSQPPFIDAFVESTSSSTLHLNANAINQGYYAKFFMELRKLGRGFRGSVYLCEHILDGVKLGKYAVKKVAIGNNHTWLVKMLREVHLLERLHHPNIVSYKHSWLEYDRLTPFGPKVPCLFILMECANGGNLEEYLEPEVSPEHQQADDKKKTPKELKRERIKRQLEEQDKYEAETQKKQPIQTQKRLLSMAEISSLFLDIVQGLAHLHQQHIVHRDLKPPNLLLKWDDRRRGSDIFKIPRVLISDFGECEDLESTPDSDRTGATGTMEFMAPEHVRLDNHGKSVMEYSSKADMWSLGMVLYYLCYSRLPYSNVDDVDVLREEILAFKEIKFPKSRFEIFQNTNNPAVVSMMETMKRQQATDIPQEFKILIRLLLSIDPGKRPSCQEILSKLDQVKFGQDKATADWTSNDAQHASSSSPPSHSSHPSHVPSSSLSPSVSSKTSVASSLASSSSSTPSASPSFHHDTAMSAAMASVSSSLPAQKLMPISTMAVERHQRSSSSSSSWSLRQNSLPTPSRPSSSSSSSSTLSTASSSSSLSSSSLSSSSLSSQALSSTLSQTAHTNTNQTNYGSVNFASSNESDQKYVIDSMENSTDGDGDTIMESNLFTPTVRPGMSHNVSMKRMNNVTHESDGNYSPLTMNDDRSYDQSSLHGLRKRQKLSNHVNNTDIVDAHQTPLLLLDAHASFYSRLLHDEQLYLQLLKTVTAVFKIATCTYPCLPYSTKPAIFYPIILLATVDFWSEKISHSLLLLAIHLIWLISMALLSGGMCMTGY